MIDFPAAEVRFTTIKVKLTIECEYEMKSMEDYEAVRESVESAVDTLRQYGSATVTATTESNEIVPTTRPVRRARR